MPEHIHNRWVVTLLFYVDTNRNLQDIKTMIQQCPINIECELSEILDYGQNEGIIGRVVKSYINPECLTDGKLDMRKVHPIIWATGGDFNYYQLGNQINQEEK